MSKYQDIKDTLRKMGYAFNRNWTINLPSGNYIQNSKLGGWKGLELWCRGENGLDSMLKKQSDEFLTNIQQELAKMQED